MEKFIFSMVTICMLIGSRSIVMGLAVLLTNTYLIVGLGGISLKRYIHLLRLPVAFLVLSIITIIFNLSKTPFDAFAFKIGGYFITGSWADIHKGFQLFVTAMSAVSCLYFLSLNTTMTDILEVLKKLKVPALICELMLLIYRYIFILMDFAYNIGNAQRARLGDVSYKVQMKSFVLLVQSIFVRAIKRANAQFDAMEARLYDTRILVVSEYEKASKAHVVAIFLFEAMLLSYGIIFRNCLFY